MVGYDKQERNPYKQQIANKGDLKLPKDKIQEAFVGLVEIRRISGDMNMIKKATLDRTILEQRIQHL